MFIRLECACVLRQKDKDLTAYQQAVSAIALCPDILYDLVDSIIQFEYETNNETDFDGFLDSIQSGGSAYLFAQIPETWGNCIFPDVVFHSVAIVSCDEKHALTAKVKLLAKTPHKWKKPYLIL